MIRFPWLWKERSRLDTSDLRDSLGSMQGLAYILWSFNHKVYGKAFFFHFVTDRFIWSEHSYCGARRFERLDIVFEFSTPFVICW